MKRPQLVHSAEWCLLNSCSRNPVSGPERCPSFPLLVLVLRDTCNATLSVVDSFAASRCRTCLHPGDRLQRALQFRFDRFLNQPVTDRGNVVKNLFVGSLGSEVTHEELRRLFETRGQVVQVHIIVDRDTGLPRGFAFVEMTNDAEAEKAIKALNGSILRDRALNVNYARPRPERPAA